MALTQPSLSPSESVRRVAHARAVILNELRQVVLGQDALLEQLLIALFAGGHCLIEGTPGTGKTLAIRALAKVLHLDFSHLHCHPELTSEDVLGREIQAIHPATGHRESQFQRGPLFANVVLVDEFNRAPHRAQAAWLQPLLQQRLAVAGTCYELATPFLLVATRNTTEQQQVFPLSDAVTDRFLMAVSVDLPSREEEFEIATADKTLLLQIRQVMRPRDVLWVQDLVRRIVATHHVIDYAVDLVRATRPDDPASPVALRRWVREGAGPRAVQALVMGAKCRAMLHGRCAVHAADVRTLLPNVLRHRLHWHPAARQEGARIEHVVAELIQSVSENHYGERDCSPPELEVVDRGESLPPSVEVAAPAPGEAGVSPEPSSSDPVQLPVSGGDPAAEAWILHSESSLHSPAGTATSYAYPPSRPLAEKGDT